MSEQRLQQQLNFLMEIDQLKQVERQTAITGGSRRENTAEHSWHLAMYALVLQEWSNVDVNIAHVLALCLVHDIVEIDAGDTFAYDTTGYADKDAREQKAADRLFGLLPDDQRDRLRSLWNEYGRPHAASDAESPCRRRLAVETSRSELSAGSEATESNRRRIIGFMESHRNVDQASTRPRPTDRRLTTGRQHLQLQ
jgi:5'-deoxynucleotidase YfbR-like HD superfamily hydrolase